MVISKIDGAQCFMGNGRVLIAGGGTGGHLFPALAIGEEIQRREPLTKIHYVGSIFGLEAKVFPVKDVWHTLLPMRGLQRGFGFQSFSRNVLLPSKIIKSFYKMRTLFKDFIPQIIVGTGGYASALPLFMATRKRYSYPIVLQEQNSFPGITTRWFASKSDATCIAFEEANEYLKRETILTGNPVRKGIANGSKIEASKKFNLSLKNKTIFLFGGSQGSAYLNKMIFSIIKNLTYAGLQIIWQTGDKDYIKYKHYSTKNTFITPFINDMAGAYALADLIICRSGALTLSEITLSGKASILIPYPYAAGNHQTKNAQALVDAGAAKILSQKLLKPKQLLHSIITLIHNQNELTKMSSSSRLLGKPNATREIVDQILEIAK